MTVLAGLLLLICLVAGTAAAWILFLLFGPSMRLNTLPRAVPTSSHAPVIPAPRLGSAAGHVAWNGSPTAIDAPSPFGAAESFAPAAYASDTSPFAPAPAFASDAPSPFVAPSRPTPARAAATPARPAAARPTPIAARNQRLAEPFVAPPLKRPRPSPPPMPRARAARGTDSSTRDTRDFEKTNEVRLFATDEHTFVDDRR